MREKESFNIAAAIYAAISLALLLFPVSGFVHTVRAVCAYSLYPAIYYGEQADFFLRGVPENFRKIFSTEQENRNLREKVKSLELELENARASVSEAMRLRDEMNLGKTLKWQGSWARVSDRDSRNWYGFITINKGTADGVRINDTVISLQSGKASLIGRVYEANKNFSRIMLAGNKACSIIVSLGHNGKEVLAEGTGTSKMKIVYIPEDFPLSDGMEVFTAPSASLYVPNLRLGTLSKIYKRDSEVSFISADIELSADLDSLKEVYVIRHKLPDDLIPPAEEN